MKKERMKKKSTFKISEQLLSVNFQYFFVVVTFLSLNDRKKGNNQIYTCVQFQSVSLSFIHIKICLSFVSQLAEMTDALNE